METKFNYPKRFNYNEELHIIFKELLPNNSLNSFKWNKANYKHTIKDVLGNCNTFEEEKERFKNYLINLYELKQYY